MIKRYCLVLLFMSFVNVSLASDHQFLQKTLESNNNKIEAQLHLDQQQQNQSQESQLHAEYQSGLQKQEQQLLLDEEKRLQALEESLR